MRKRTREKMDITAMIVDDERHAAEELASLLEEGNGVVVKGLITDPNIAVEEILKASPGLLFLDIRMPGKDGFEILRELSNHGFEPAVIFVTAYEQYAIDAIKHAAFDYILKPVEKQELYQALFRYSITYAHTDLAEKYRKLFDATDTSRVIRVPAENGYHIIKLDDIIYVESDYHCTRVWKSRDNYCQVMVNLGFLEKQLPAGSFFRISPDVIVNLNYLYRVKKLFRQCILQKDNETFILPVSLSNVWALDKLRGSCQS